VRLWDSATGKTRATLREADWVTSLAFNPDGKTVVSQGSNMLGPYGMTVWDVTTGEKVTTLKETNYPLSVAFSKDGTRLVFGTTGGALKLWDTATWRETYVIRGHQLAVISLAFSPDGRLVASASGNDGKWGEVKVWDVPAREVPDK
jgi:WD40 repeat protein